ncbi:MAG: hypothetical protein ACRCYO_12980 [Bacteroidia bacterium]
MKTTHPFVKTLVIGSSLVLFSGFVAYRSGLIGEKGIQKVVGFSAADTPVTRADTFSGPQWDSIMKGRRLQMSSSKSMYIPETHPSIKSVNDRRPPSRYNRDYDRLGNLIPLADTFSGPQWDSIMKQRQLMMYSSKSGPVFDEDDARDSQWGRMQLRCPPSRKNREYDFNGNLIPIPDTAKSKPAGANNAPQNTTIHKPRLIIMSSSKSAEVFHPVPDSTKKENPK